MDRQRIALFDFDGTIARGDSIVPYLGYGILTGFIPFRALLMGLWAYLHHLLGRMEDEQAKEAVLAFIKGKTKEEADAFAQRFFDRILKKRIYGDALREIARLKDEKVHVIIVTASPDVYMQAAARALNADGIIATRLAWDEENRCLGRLASPNCKGFEKTLRIVEYLAAAGIEPEVSQSLSYGDTLSDVPMLGLTANPHMVNGSRKAIRQTPAMAHIRWGKAGKTINL